MRRLIGILLALVLGIFTVSQPPGAERRVLNVEFYPYILDAEGAAYVIKRDYERLHPDVDPQITYNADYYDPDGIANDAAKNPADDYERDSVFLADFIENEWIQPLPAEVAPLLHDVVPLWTRIQTVGGLPDVGVLPSKRSSPIQRRLTRSEECK